MNSVPDHVLYYYQLTICNVILSITQPSLQQTTQQEQSKKKKKIRDCMFTFLK